MANRPKSSISKCCGTAIFRQDRIVFREDAARSVACQLTGHGVSIDMRLCPAVLAGRFDLPAIVAVFSALSHDCNRCAPVKASLQKTKEKIRIAWAS